MSTTAQQPATTPMPVQLSKPEFEACIFPHLSMPKRSPQCKPSYYCVFHLILRVLYTGMQWQCLPAPTGPHQKPALYTRPSTKSLRNGRVIGRWGRRSPRVWGIWRQSNPSTPACSIAAGRTLLPKRGEWHWLFRPQEPKGRESHRYHRQPAAL